MHKYQKGFTLAEVLITLLIIGVVASLVIPALIQDTQEAELRTAWKRAFSDINQVANLVKQENGGTLAGLCPSGYPDCLHYPFFDTYFAKYLENI